MRGLQTGTRSQRERGKEGARAQGHASSARGEWEAEKGRGESDVCELAPELTGYLVGQPLSLAACRAQPPGAPPEPQKIA